MGKDYYDANEYEKLYSLLVNLIKRSNSQTQPRLYRLLLSNFGHFWMAVKMYGKAALCYERALAIGENVPDIVKANYCASLLLSNQKDKADKVLESLLHTQVMNVLISQFYCSCGRWELGISRILNFEVDQDSWKFAKQIILGFIIGIAKGEIDRDMVDENGVPLTKRLIEFLDDLDGTEEVMQIMKLLDRVIVTVI